jgi:hypothetical protein
VGSVFLNQSQRILKAKSNSCRSKKRSPPNQVVCKPWAKLMSIYLPRPSLCQTTEKLYDVCRCK